MSNEPVLQDPPPRLANLRRITSGGKFIPEIDGFRLLAILVVLNEHIYLQVAYPRGIYWPALLTLPDGGMRGVYLFFTISGFILGLPFARRALTVTSNEEPSPFNYIAYLKRRVTRLEPPYVLVLMLRLALILTVLRTGDHAVFGHFFATLFYAHSLVYGAMSTISPPTWSLEVEVQFYLLAPLLSAVFLIRGAAFRRAILILVIIGSSMISDVPPWSAPRLMLSLAGNLQYFAAGLLLCDLYLTQPLRWISKYLWDGFGIAAITILLCSSHHWTLFFFPFGSLMVYLAGLRGHYVRAFFAAPLVSVAGGMCYSIYLTHGTVLTAVSMAFAHFPLNKLPLLEQRTLILTVSLLAAFLVGAACFVTVERPCMNPRWPERMLQFMRRGLSGRARPYPLRP